MMRKKILSQAQKEKEALEEKLNYLSHSIVELSKFDLINRAKSPLAMRQSYSVVEKRGKEEWRKEI